MTDEYNNLIITNDVRVTNDPQLKSAVEEVADLAAETESVTELTSVKEITEGVATKQKIAKASANVISRIMNISGTVAVVAAVAVVAVAEVSAASTPEPTVPSAPAAVISEMDVTSFGYDKYLSVQFTMTDDGEEIESYLVWIEDVDGDVCECTVETDGNVWTAVTELTDDADWETGLSLVVYAESYEGWTGEIYREAVTLPEATTVVSGTDAVSYSYDTYLSIQLTLTDESQQPTSYSVWFEDADGDICECAVEIDGNIWTATAELTDDIDRENGLTLIAEAECGNGWTGEIYRETMTLPTAPDIGVEYTTAYNADSGEVIITYELYDEYSLLSEYTAQLLDTSGNELSYTTDYAEQTITTTVTDSTIELYLVIGVTSTDRWTGEIFNEAVALPTAPDIGIEYTTAYNADSGEVIITYELYDEYSLLSDYTAQLIDSNGNELSYTTDYAEQTITTTVTDSASEIYLVIGATSTERWTGEIFNEAIQLPTVPDIGIEYTTAYNADSGEVTITYELYDEHSLLSDYTAQLLDASGNELTYETDYAEQTITTTVTDSASEIYLIIGLTSTERWTGEIFNEVITLPTATDVTMSGSIWVDTSYSTSDGTENLSVGGMEYEGTTENIAYYTYWFEDEDGQTYEFTVTEDSDSSLRSDTTLPTDPSPAFDMYGRLYLVIAATTTEGWTGEIYREKYVINIDAPTEPELWDPTISASEDGIMYVDMYLIIYDPDDILSDINVTLTDSAGETGSYTVSDSDIFEIETSTYGTNTYYVRFEFNTFTPDADGCVDLYVTATYTVPGDDGNYTVYEGVLYDYPAYVEGY